MDDTVLPEWSCVRLGHLFQEASSSVAFTQTAERLLLQCIDLLDTKDTKNDDEEDIPELVGTFEDAGKKK